MSLVFHCYEFLLIKRLEQDAELLNELKEKFTKEGERSLWIQNIPSELWFLAITLVKTRERFSSFLKNLVTTPLLSDTLLSRYLHSYDFVELHLDSIFKYGEGNTLPRELFRCTNVRALSLKYNFLEWLPADIGRLHRLEYLALTNNRLQNASIPQTLSFCRNLRVLLLDNNLLDALPGFLLAMPSLQTVHRHGNHNYFKATFMWYHTDVNDRILPLSECQAMAVPPNCASLGSTVRRDPRTLQFLSAQTIIASKVNFYWSQPPLPHILMDYISEIYCKFNICGNCPKVKLQSEGGMASLHFDMNITSDGALNREIFSIGLAEQFGYKVFTFKNPYLGNTCVPFQHWACCMRCAQAIEVPARVEQILSSREQDREYDRYVRAAQTRCCPAGHRHHPHPHHLHQLYHTNQNPFNNNNNHINNNNNNSNSFGFSCTVL